MHYNYYLEACSLIFLVFTAVAYYSRKKFPIPAFKIFGIFLAVATVNLILNITASIALDTPGVSLFWHEFLNELFYYSQILLSYIFFAYVLYGVGKSLRYSPLYNLTMLPSIALAIMIFTNSAHHLIFTVTPAADGLVNFTHGPAYFMMYVISGLNIASALIYTIYFRKSLPKNVLTVLLIVTGIISAAIIIQFYLPTYLLSGLSYTLSSIIIIITINDPDEKVDRISKAFNNDAFIEYINNQRSESQRKYYIIFEIESFGMFNRMFGRVYANRLVAKIVKIIEGIDRKAYIFKTRSTRFVLLSKSKEEQLRMVESLKEKFSSPISVDEKEVNISVRLLYFYNNGIFRNSDTYNAFLKKAESLINFKESNYVELDQKFIDVLSRDKRIKEILENCLKSELTRQLNYQASGLCID